MIRSAQFRVEIKNKEYEYSDKCFIHVNSDKLIKNYLVNESRIGFPETQPFNRNPKSDATVGARS